VLRPRVHLSARRWEARGVLATTLLNWRVARSWRRGVSPERLYQRYYGASFTSVPPGDPADGSAAAQGE